MLIKIPYFFLGWVRTMYEFEFSVDKFFLSVLGMKDRVDPLGFTLNFASIFSPYPLLKDMIDSKGMFFLYSNFI